MRLLLISLIYLLLANHIKAQQITVLVQDETGLPIPYCSVGLFGKGIGTVTNEHGMFVFSESQIRGVQQLKVSHIAYESQKLLLTNIKASKSLFVITLKAKIIDAGTFIVRDDGFDQEKVLGSKNAEINIIRAHSEKLNYGEIMGNSFAIKKPSLLDELRFKIKLEECTGAKFRVHIIEMKKKKVTSNELLTKDLIVEVDSSGWYSTDLSQLDLVVNTNILIGLEFLGVEGCPYDLTDQKMPYAFHMANYRDSYIQPSNTEKWVRMNGLGIAFQLKVFQ